MFHWQDAYEYRKTGKVIIDEESMAAYTAYQLENCERKLIQAGVDLVNAEKVRSEISFYAKDSLVQENNYEEVFAEYRTRILLGK